MKTNGSILSTLAVLFLITASISIVSADTLYVKPSDDVTGLNHTAIQAAVDNSSNGDTILIYPGDYVENVDVDVANITISSVSGKPESTVVRAKLTGDHVIDVSEENVTISGLKITGANSSSKSGIYIGANNGSAVNNLLFDNYHGILIKGSKSNVTNNTVQDNEYGIKLEASSNNTIRKNRINSSVYKGIYLYNASDNTLLANNVSLNEIGIQSTYESKRNSFVGNFIRDNDCGVELSGEDNIFSSNVLWDNTYNFYVGDEKFLNKTDTSNLADGKTIYYLVDVSDFEINSSFNAATVYGINCEHITIRDSDLKNNAAGIYLYGTNSSTLENNSLSYNGVGLYLENCSKNNLNDNGLSDNEYGIGLLSSNNTEINENSLEGNLFGIYGLDSGGNKLDGNIVSGGMMAVSMMESYDNSFSGNTITETPYGIMLHSSGNNNLSGNTVSNTFWAFWMMESQRDTFSKNKILNNGLGILAMGTENITIVNNNISNEASHLAPSDPLSCLFSCHTQDKNIYEESGIVEEKRLPGENGIFKARTAPEDKAVFKAEGPFSEEGSTGILLMLSNNGVLEGNRISNYSYGVACAGALNSELYGNRLENNSVGITLLLSNGSLYNNYFNNTNNTAFDETLIFNVEDDEGEEPLFTWNITKTEGKNIANGPYLGGNFWGLPDGTGFSQTHEDADGDGFCDVPYNVTEDGLNVDYFPLVEVPEEETETESISSHSGGSPKYIPSPSPKIVWGVDSAQKRVNAGSETRFGFHDPENDVLGVGFKPKKYSGITVVRVEGSDGNGANGAGKPKGTVYRYMTILVGNEPFESSDNIDEGHIDFRVSKSWVEENGIDPYTIVLNRYSDGTWNSLSTEMTDEDDEYYYFTAATPGFSLYAITGNEEGTGTPEKTEIIIPVEEEAEPISETGDESEKEKTPGFGVIISGAGILLAGAGLERKKNRLR